MDVTVVGAGVIGLTTGVLLQEAGTSTRILTNRPVAGTTSNAAGGIWYPYNAPDDPEVEGWMRDTLVELKLLADEEPALVRRCEAHQYFYEPEADPYWSTMPDLFRHADPSELPAGRTHGWVFSSVIIDTPRYIEWLRQRFEKAGGEILQQEVTSLDDLNGLIMNCAGVGANQIAADPTVYPIRGQVIRIANPGLEFATLDDENPAGLTYILPRFDDCILGGSSDVDDWNLESDAELTQAILRRCSEVEPRLPELKSLMSGLACVPVVHRFASNVKSGPTPPWSITTDTQETASRRRGRQLAGPFICSELNYHDSSPEISLPARGFVRSKKNHIGKVLADFCRQYWWMPPIGGGSCL